MTHRATTIAFGLALLGSFPSTGLATPIIFDGGVPDQRGVYFADTDYAFTAAAMPFSVSPGDSIGGAEWWGGCYAEAVPEITAEAAGDPGSPPAGTGSNTCGGGAFVLSFYEDDGAGAPGTLINSFSVGTANQTATGAFIGIGDFITEYAYSATFGPLELDPSGTYWFAVSNTLAGTTWGMESAGGEGTHQQLSDTWASHNDQLAFRLLGPDDVEPVPEPAMLSLVALGLGGAAWRRRRTRGRSS